MRTRTGRFTTTMPPMVERPLQHHATPTAPLRGINGTRLVIVDAPGTSMQVTIPTFYTPTRSTT